MALGICEGMLFASAPSIQNALAHPRRVVNRDLAKHSGLQREGLETAGDAELVAQHLAGDPRAFAELVKRYTNAIYNLAYRFTGDRAEAENLTQETFLRAWHALPRIALDKPLKPYLLQIVWNLCRDWAAKRQGVDIVSLDAEDDSSPGETASSGDEVWTALSERELSERIRMKWEQLPPTYRAVIALRYTEGLSYQEMATALGLPLNTVRTHLRRAKARLRALLQES